MSDVEHLIQEALDLHVAAIEEERKPDGKWHPSSMWMCARSAVLGVRGVPPSALPDAQAKRIFRIGHLYHELVQSALPGHPKIKSVYPEFKIDVPEWNVSGAGDALVELDSGDWYVVEVKSTKSLRFTPKEDHKKQASIYFTAARDFGFWIESSGGTSMESIPGLYFMDPLGSKLKGIILVYLNKADLEMKEYVYEYTKSWRTAIEKRVKELDKYRLVQIEDLPPPIPALDKGKRNWYFDYCPYRGSGMCCGDSQEDFEW